MRVTSCSGTADTKARRTRGSCVAAREGEAGSPTRSATHASERRRPRTNLAIPPLLIILPHSFLHISPFPPIHFHPTPPVSPLPFRPNLPSHELRAMQQRAERLPDQTGAEQARGIPPRAASRAHIVPVGRRHESTRKGGKPVLVQSGTRYSTLDRLTTHA